MMRRFATARQRRLGLIAMVVGNVLPVLLLGSYHKDTITGGHVVGMGGALAVLSPLAVNLIPLRWQMLIRLSGYASLVGLTMMQAYTGGVGSSYAILFVMPMVWFALTADGREMVGIVVVMLSCCLLPMWIWPEQYPQAVRPALALAVVSLTVLLSLFTTMREVGRLTGQLRHEATHDRLTGLLNRRGWDEITERRLAATAPGVPICVLLVDLDKLKRINDTLGHEEGDRVLRETADRLYDAFGAEAALCRLGGDEFAALVIGNTAEEMQARLERLRLVTPERGAFSVGFAIAGAREAMGDAMRRADLALYEVKSTGRGRAALAQPPIGTGGA